MQIDSLLGIDDIRKIFGGISQVTVYRWLREARQGQSRFPLNINGAEGKKRKLFWNPADIERYLQSQSVPSPPPPPVTPRRRAKTERVRQAAVQQVLKRHGIDYAIEPEITTANQEGRKMQ